MNVTSNILSFVATLLLFHCVIAESASLAQYTQSKYPCTPAEKDLQCSVIFAKVDLRGGEKIKESDIESKKVPAKYVPVQALRSIKNVVGKASKEGCMMGMILQARDLSASEMPIKYKVLVAAKELAQGKKIESSDLSAKELVFTKVPNEAFRSAEDIAGKRLKKSINKGSFITVTDIEKIPDYKTSTVVFAAKNLSENSILKKSDMIEKQELSPMVPPDAIWSMDAINGRKLKYDVAEGTIISQFDLAPEGL